MPACDDGPEPPVGLRGEAHGQRRAAVIGVAQRHDFGRSGVAAGGENRGFVGFGAAVGEERFGELAGGRDLGQFLRERGLRLIGEDGGYVLQLVDLRVQLLVHLFVAVADADGDDAAEEIQILIAVRVPHVLIFGVRDHQRFFVVVEDGGEEMVAVGEQDVFFGHV